MIKCKKKKKEIDELALISLEPTPIEAAPQPALIPPEPDSL
jgi:hypothetical protein